MWTLTSALRAAALGLVLILASSTYGVLAQNEATMPLYQLHGSGTSNPALLLWRAMDTMMARTKPKIAMSYRSVGSGSGAVDFNATASAFGCGDVPIPAAIFNNTRDRDQPMIHVPYLVGSVSIFHNVPGIGKGMYLDPCTLGRIFRGNISSWNDPAIVSLNPHMPDLATKTQPIRIVHRNPGSSSTYALTNYLNMACRPEWSGVNPSTSATGTGPNDNRPVGVTTLWPADAPGRWQTVENSQMMVEQIGSYPYSLGYVESGQGVNAGLMEVAIKNANGTTLTSSDAEIASVAFITEQFPLSDLGSFNWTTVNPVYASKGNPKQWPMTLGTYFYVYRNLTFLNETGSLLLQFLNYVLSDDVAAIMPEYGFSALPQAVRNGIQASLASTLTVSSAVNWTTETATQNIVGQQNYVFSKRRDSYQMNTIAGLATESSDAKRTLMLGDAYQVHGSGSFVSAVMLRHAMQILQSRARVPISMTYRAVGSLEAQAELADYRNMYKSYNHFKVTDMPLDSANWTALSSAPAVNTTAAVLQLPFAVSALGLYYNKALPSAALTLNCTLLARLYGGAVSSWSDPELVALNGYSEFATQTLLNHTLTVFAMAQPSGPTWALTGYLAKACPQAWASGQAAGVAWASGVMTSYQGSPIRTPEDMLAAIAGTANSIGYLPSPLGAGSGLASAQLVVDGLPAPLRLARADLTEVVTRAKAANAALFSDPTVDVAASVGLSLYGVNGTWPMPMVQYLNMYRNLSGYGYSGPLLRAFAEFLLSSEGSALATSSGLAPMPASVQSAMRSALALSILKTLTVVWDSETSGTYGDTGSGLYTFSANRMSYDAYALAALQREVTSVKGRLAAALPATLRLACTADILGYTRLLRADLQEMASTPVRVLDEMVPANASINALNAAVRGSDAPTHMIIHPGPLPRNQWQALARDVAIVQIPVAVRPVAVVYKGSAGVRMSPCTLAKIIKGEITKWDDPTIKAENPSFTFPPRTIQLLSGGTDDADARAVLRYVLNAAPVASCPSANGLTLPTAGFVPNEDIIAQLAAGENSYAALGFVAAAGLVSEAGIDAGLQAVQLPSVVSGTYVTPMQVGSGCPAFGCAGVVAKAYTSAVEDIIRSSLNVVSSKNALDVLGAPLDRTGDWSSFDLRSRNAAQPGVDVYPVFRLDFLVVPADLTAYGDEGAVVRSAIEYGAGGKMADRVNAALGPYFAGLGEQARAQLVAPGLSALLSSTDAPEWTIVASSAQQAVSANSAATLVLSRAPLLSDVALPGSDASSLATSVNTTSVADVQVLAQQAALNAVAVVRADQDKLDLAYSIGVAALILALVLSLSALVLAAYAVALLRRGSRSATAGGCLTPAAKYEPHVDAPAGHMEMQTQQRA